MIKISEQIAPHFHNTFHSKKVHQIDSGGRGSTKTSKNARKIALYMMKYDNCHAVGIRKHKNTLRQSIFAEFKEALNSFGLEEDVDYIARVSPMMITLVETGNNIYFGGMDDHNKLKGMIATRTKKTDEMSIEDILNASDDFDDVKDNEKAQIKLVWLSEINEFKEEEEILQTVATFSRGKKDFFCVLYEYNPPKNKYHWVNKWTVEMAKRDDCLHVHSDYRTVSIDWLGSIFIQQAEELKKSDYDRYRWIYLGDVIGIEGLIYNYEQINQIDKLDDGEFVVSVDVGVDGGHQTSSTPFLAVGVTNFKRIVLLDTYFYSPAEKTIKKSPSDYSLDLNNFVKYIEKEYNTSVEDIIIDSAEGGLRNEYFKMYGRRIKPVSKSDNETMWDFVIDLFAKGIFYVLKNKNNEIFNIEHRNYEYKDGTIEKGKPEANKEEKKLKEIKYYNSHSKEHIYYFADHTCDAFKYIVKMKLRKYGLKY